MTTKDEKILTELKRHYDMASEDFDVRRPSMDKADEYFRSYINEAKWPYSSVMFVPKIFTFIFEKTSRLIGQKPRGRLVPREGGDVVGAKVNNELLNFQWDDASRIDYVPMIAKWAMMDMNARKYGASFALCTWRYERKLVKDGKDKYSSVPYFDGPSFRILNNRDVLANPSYETIKNWFQYREYLTLEELQSVNEAAREKPIYENLDELYDKLRHETKVSDTRETNYSSRNKSIKGYQDYLGRDMTNRVVEVVTEYRPTRWITYAPKHGIILRDIPNPYKHQEIPVVMLKYYAIDDDLYGIPEWEPIEKMQKGMNALTSQYIDAVNIELHSPIGVDSTRVRMHTLDFGADKKWIVTGDPATAIKKYDFGSPNAIGAYKTIYSVLDGELQQGVGESSAMTSNANVFKNDKTATEIKDTASQRLSRDNFNQIFLAEAIKRQMQLWYSMNQQFYFNPGETDKIVRIVGKDAIAYFASLGMADQEVGDVAMNQIAEAQAQGDMSVNPTDFQTPIYPVETEQGFIPKMTMSPRQDYAELHITPEDLSGNYDYIADIGSMQVASQQEELLGKAMAIKEAKDPQALMLLQQEGKMIKFSELLTDYLELSGFKDASKYIENATQNQQLGQPIQPGQAPGQAIHANSYGGGSLPGSTGAFVNEQNAGMGNPQAGA